MLWWLQRLDKDQHDITGDIVFFAVTSGTNAVGRWPLTELQSRTVYQNDVAV